MWYGSRYTLRYSHDTVRPVAKATTPQVSTNFSFVAFLTVFRVNQYHAARLSHGPFITARLFGGFGAQVFILTRKQCAAVRETTPKLRSLRLSIVCVSMLGRIISAAVTVAIVRHFIIIVSFLATATVNRKLGNFYRLSLQLCVFYLRNYYYKFFITRNLWKILY